MWLVKTAHVKFPLTFYLVRIQFLLANDFLLGYPSFSLYLIEMFYHCLYLHLANRQVTFISCTRRGRSGLVDQRRLSTRVVWVDGI